MVEITQATGEEEEKLAEIGLAAWRKGIKPLVSKDVAARIESDNPFLPFLRDMKSRLLVAVVEGEAAGIGGCEKEDDYISDIWVDPAFEGRGVGSALLQALEREIAGRGYRRARIHVAAANERALRLYQHRGYRQIWRKTAYDPILEIALEKIELAKDNESS